VLGTTLGVLTTQWPYRHDCGIPLAAYLVAVAMVMLAGIWISVVSWNLRSAAAHVLAFLLLLWGCALAAERALPRIGYAAEQGSWTCNA
jgi:heme A synthase